MSYRSVDEYLTDAKRKVPRRLLECIPLFIAGVGVLALAYFSCFMPENENPGRWFQRSGSIAVLIAVWIEIILLSIRSDVVPSGSTAQSHLEFADQFINYYNIASYATAGLAIVGTLIWGYGDIIYDQLG